MSRLDKLKAELRERWSGNATLELCLRLVDIMDELPDDEMNMLTFASFMNLVERAKIDEELIRAVGLLSNTSVHALDSKLLFIDDDDREFEIEKEELAAARKSGEFIHPESGAPVPQFESKIISYFVPSDKFKKLRAG
jgi:hypothetical protein